MRLPFVIAVTLCLYITDPAFSAERFSADHICDPKLSNIAISECMASYYKNIEKKRLEEEQKNIIRAQGLSVSHHHYSGLPERTKESKSAFENYREIECKRIWAGYGAGSLGGTGYSGCLITLTEQRIRQIEP